MKTLIDETIRVGAVFEKQKGVKPIWFIWQGREHRIKEITYRWRSRCGSAIIRHFSVTDDTALYELRFNTCSCIWKLGQVETME